MAIKNGTTHNDNITDSGAWNTVFGYAGNDTINASTSTIGVMVLGGDGNDVITGSALRDNLFGGNGNDIISSGAGNDIVYGGFGNDLITGGAGNDQLFGDSGNDTMNGGAGNQTLFGGDGNDTVNLGVDVTSGNKHFLYGGNGNDAIVGATGASSTGLLNAMFGGAGNDTMTGSVAGHDTLNGGIGTNVITGNAANHANELAGFGDMGAAVSVNLALTTAQTVATVTAVAVIDTITNVDNLNGSIYADTLTGNLNGNTIYGGLGADTIDSGGTSTAAALNAVNAGSDSLFGGGGNDTFVIHSGSTAVTADSIDGGIGSNTVDFSKVAFTAGTGAVLTYAGDTVALPAGSSSTYATPTQVEGVYVNLTQSIDFNSTESFTGGAGAGVTANIQHVIGTGGTDYLVAVGGATMDGGAGNDTLVTGGAGTGHDVLNGGAGNNIYDGSAVTQQDYFGISNSGVNTLVTGATANKEFDTIYSFNNVQQADKLMMSAANFGITVAATGTANSNVDFSGVGSANSAGSNASFFTAHYSATGALASLTLDTNGVALTTNAGMSTFANATGHAEFVYNTDSGDLFYVPTGTAAGALSASVWSGGALSAGGTLAGSGATANGATAIAHIDTNSAILYSTAIGSHSANPIDSTDFILTV